MSDASTKGAEPLPTLDLSLDSKVIEKELALSLPVAPAARTFIRAASPHR